MGRNFFLAGINEAWVGAEKVLRCGASAKTALVAPLLRAGEAVMWRFQPLCRARWPFVGEGGRGGARRADPFSGSVRRSMAPVRVGRSQLHGAAFFPGKSRLRFKNTMHKKVRLAPIIYWDNTSAYPSRSLIGEQIKFPVSNARR